MKAKLWHVGLSTEQKTTLQREFQTVPVCEGGPQVLCGVQSSMGTGVDLFAANYVIFLEPYAQPTKQQQAVKRSHRRGQTQKTFIHRIHCAGERGVGAERVLLKRASAREWLATGVFKTNDDAIIDIDNDEDEQLET